jgi:hypothetical protein
MPSTMLRKVRLSGFFTLMALLLVVGVALGHQPNKPCREHPNLVAPCFTVHARMRYYNGAPSVRLWPIGTDRLLGVSEGRFDIVGYQNLPYSLRETLDRRREIYADFVVCPFTPSEPGVMRLVCVDSATKIVTKSVAVW